MPTPLGHSLAGYVVNAYTFKTLRIPEFKTLIIFIFAANAPDLDFIPGLLIGKPNLFHHGVTHSVGAALIFSGLLSLSFCNKTDRKFGKYFLIFFTLYSSHLLLDYLAFDGRPPFGIPIFWPLNDNYFIFPHPIFPGVMHSRLTHATFGQFITDAFSIHNLYVAFIECIILLPFLLIVSVYNRPKKAV